MKGRSPPKKRDKMHNIIGGMSWRPREISKEKYRPASKDRSKLDGRKNEKSKKERSQSDGSRTRECWECGKEAEGRELASRAASTGGASIIFLVLPILWRAPWSAPWRTAWSVPWRVP